MVTEQDINAFALAVGNLVGTTQPNYPNLPKPKRKQIVASACLEIGNTTATMATIFDAIEYFKQTLSAKMAHRGPRVVSFNDLDEKASLGHRTLLRIGNEITKQFNYRHGKMERKEPVPLPVIVVKEPIAGNSDNGLLVETVPTNSMTVAHSSKPVVCEDLVPKRMSAEATYTYLVDNYDLIPPDTMIGWFTKISISAFSTARRVLRAKGYEIESVSYNCWQVVKRPVPAAVLLQQVQEKLLDRLGKASASDLEKMLAALK